MQKPNAKVRCHSVPKVFRFRRERVACLATCKVAPVSWYIAIPRASCGRPVVALPGLTLTMLFNSVQVHDNCDALRLEAQAALAMVVGADPQMIDNSAQHRTLHP